MCVCLYNLTNSPTYRLITACNPLHNSSCLSPRFIPKISTTLYENPECFNAFTSTSLHPAARTTCYNFILYLERNVSYL